MSYSSIIVGTDGSATAELAVRHAAQMAGLSGARLVVVTAFEPQGDPLAETEGAPDDLKWLLTDRSQAEERARHGRELAQGEGVTGVVVQAIEGRPADVLLTAATDFNAELIVVGSKGLTGAARVLGSVASSVSHHAPCDVLIVHTTS